VQPNQDESIVADFLALEIVFLFRTPSLPLSTSILSGWLMVKHIRKDIFLFDVAIYVLFSLKPKILLKKCLAIHQAEIQKGKQSTILNRCV
jgi:hypothetical protein